MTAPLPTELPQDWQARVGIDWPDWNDLPSDFDEEAARSVARAGSSYVPDHFHLYVRPSRADWAIWLGYVYRDGAVRLALAAATDVDVPQALEQLRSARPLGWWARYATLQVVQQVAVFTSDDLAGDPVDGENAWAGVRGAVERQRSRSQQAAAAVPVTARRNRVTDSHLEQVAELYREAQADGAPTLAVSERWGTSHSTAARWVQRARAAGLLPPTRPGSSGLGEPQ